MELTERRYFEKELLKGTLKDYWKLFLKLTLITGYNTETWEHSIYVINNFDFLYGKFKTQLPYLERELKITKWETKNQIT